MRTRVQTLTPKMPRSLESIAASPPLTPTPTPPPTHATPASRPSSPTTLSRASTASTTSRACSSSPRSSSGPWTFWWSATRAWPSTRSAGACVTRACGVVCVYVCVCVRGSIPRKSTAIATIPYQHIHSHIHIIYPQHTLHSFDARGFVLGPPLALAMNRPFFMLRKQGKMPNVICGEKYSKVNLRCVSVGQRGVSFRIAASLFYGGVACLCCSVVAIPITTPPHPT